MHIARDSDALGSWRFSPTIRIPLCSGSGSELSLQQWGRCRIEINSLECCMLQPSPALKGLVVVVGSPRVVDSRLLRRRLVSVEVGSIKVDISGHWSRWHWSLFGLALHLCPLVVVGSTILPVEAPPAFIIVSHFGVGVTISILQCCTTRATTSVAIQLHILERDADAFCRAKLIRLQRRVIWSCGILACLCGLWLLLGIDIFGLELMRSFPTLNVVGSELTIVDWFGSARSANHSVHGLEIPARSFHNSDHRASLPYVTQLGAAEKLIAVPCMPQVDTNLPSKIKFGATFLGGRVVN